MKSKKSKILIQNDADTSLNSTYSVYIQICTTHDPKTNSAVNKQKWLDIIKKSYKGGFNHGY